MSERTEFWWGDGKVSIRVRKEDQEYYDYVEKKAINYIKKKGVLSRLSFFKILIMSGFSWAIISGIQHIGLGKYFYVLGILPFFFIFTNAQIKLLAQKEAEDYFIDEKVRPIPLYTSTDGLKVVKNLGMLSVDSNLKAKAAAYKAGANAVVNIKKDVASISKVSNDLSGNINTKVIEKTTITGDMVVVE
jgi:hypothetical protein